MALKLTIIDDPHNQAGRGGSIVFGVAGGGIGRAFDNDWVLADPQRFLSAHHARVQFRDGAYYLVDISTNGVFVNDGTVAIGRRAPYPLRDGDRLRMGDYQLAVAIDTERGDAPEASGIYSIDPDPLGSQSLAARDDIGVELNVRDLLRPAARATYDAGTTGAPGAGGSGAAGGDAAGAASVRGDEFSLLAFDRDPHAPPVDPRAPAAGRREPRLADRSADNAAGIEAFCRGAGIELKQLPADAAARMLQLAGVLLREALLGLKGLALQQREIREQVHVEVGKDDPQHIGLTGLPVDDLLLRLMTGHDRHELDAVQWVRDMLASTRRHDIATMRALHSALGEFLARLDPRALAQIDGRASGPDSGAQESSGLAARFRSITEMPAGKFPHLFAEAFARAFVTAFQHHNGEHARF